MQKRILLILVIFICHSSIARTLSVGWEPWPPYQYKDKRGQLTGLDIEIFQAIVKKADFTVKYTKLPWKRHLNYIKSGYIDIAFGASYSNKRDKYAYFSNCYRFEKVRLFIRKNNKFHLNKIDDLSHSEYLIGTQRGYYYGDHFTKLMQSDEFEKHVNTVLDIKQNLSMLLKKRIDGLIADPLTMKALIKKNNLTKN